MSSVTKRRKGGALPRSNFTVAGLIRQTRGNRRQEDFAPLIGVDQTLLSKYENGRANPPAHVIERCMAIAEEDEKRRDISVSEIAHRIRAELAAPELAPIRKAFSYMLDSVGRRRTAR